MKFEVQGARCKFDYPLLLTTERSGRSASYGIRAAHLFIQELALQCLLRRGKTLAVLRV